ncbi:hypothetical protein [Aeromicrobium sp. Root472D3]|uniref:hypothetical protein n=1 Tax=Aeromicrobium sp. Root472D3 TaxID=1736540 RepID=UPI0006F2BB29|nr:hypothetical protein [Aeromicrobium sp. Root472D3]KQX72500.1 hypothetical protein ASD10_16085 [Aeromicrobium sp. Root472D3]
MTWDAYNRRKNALREMLEVADRRPGTTLTELLDTADGAREAFPTETDALFDLQMTWFQRLSGQMDRLLSGDSETPELVPVTAWVTTAAELPGARALLDAHRDDPALRKAIAKELAYLAISAGSVVGADLTTHGRRIQETAREQLAAAPVVPLRDDARPGLITRLRNAIAA